MDGNYHIISVINRLARKNINQHQFHELKYGVSGRNQEGNSTEEIVKEGQ